MELDGRRSQQLRLKNFIASSGTVHVWELELPPSAVSVSFARCFDIFNKK